MKQLFILLLLLSVSNIKAEEVIIPPERQTALLHMLLQDCGACHGMTLKGGLGPSLLPETLRDKPKTFLVNTILAGRAQTAMPPWRDFLTQAEAEWLLEQLLKGINDETN